MRYNFVLKIVGDKKTTALGNIVLPYVPRVGDVFLQLTPDGKPKRKLTVLEVDVYLYHSGDKVVVETRDMTGRPYAEILLTEA